LSRIGPSAWWYKQADAFAITYPWGLPIVHSGYWFTWNGGNNNENNISAPYDSNGYILPVGTITGNVCPTPWACQHRWSDIFPLIAIRNWLGNGLKLLPTISTMGSNSNQIWYNVFDKAFIAINSAQGNQILQDMTPTVNTGLSPGTYCNMVYGYASGGTCILWPGVTLNNHEVVKYTVNVTGWTTLSIHSGDKSRVVALYSASNGYLGNQYSLTSVSFTIIENTGLGYNLFIVGDFNNWDPCNPMPCTCTNGINWQCGSHNLQTGIYYNWKPIYYSNCGSVIWKSGSNLGFTATGSSQNNFFNWTAYGP